MQSSNYNVHLLQFCCFKWLIYIVCKTGFDLFIQVKSPWRMSRRSEVSVVTTVLFTLAHDVSVHLTPQQ